MKMYYVIIAVAILTYLPRLLPFYFIKAKENTPHFVNRFFHFIPTAALGALIFPGINHATPSLPWAAYAGITVAAGVSLLKGELILPVLASIGTVILLLLIF